jgi:drug/metabolite transporter (DMT)-like permease
VNQNKTDYLLLHFIVFIWGWTAILGELITLPTDQLVWIRIMIAACGIIFWLLITRQSLYATPRNVLKYLGTGLIVGLHWVCFYGSIKVSNASVTLAVFASGSLFTAFVEPLFFKRSIRSYEIVSGILVIIAIGLIFGVETEYAWGIVLGILAALTSSFFGVINSVFVRAGHQSSVVSVYEMLGGLAGLSVYMFFAHDDLGSMFSMSSKDWLYMLLLGIACTSLPFLISLRVLRSVSPYTVSLTLNLESVYGIVLSWFILQHNKFLTVYFYIGTGIILSTLFLNAWMSRRYDRRMQTATEARE